MTIKELEARTGLTRANIRYYEQEGLLAPSRLPNGYRDYSEEDALTLERVKLLRQLHLEIDTIRLVQQGKLTLEQALFAQGNRLEGDRAAIDRAAEVCRELERAGTTYAALDPKPWLVRLETGARPPVFSPPPKEYIPAPKPLPRAFHPWMRYFARGVDITLYQTAAYLVVLLGFRQEISLPGVVQWLLSLVLLFFTFLVEPLWLHFWGWTPGKWLFGLKLRDKNGEKLTLSQAWHRGWRVAWEGYGWNIPIWSIYRLWKGRACCMDNRDCPWDEDEGYLYTKDERRFSGWGYVAVQAVCFVALIWATLQLRLPPNRGALTAEEYCENFNYYLEYLNVTDRRVDESGCWVEQEPRQGTVQIYTFARTDYADLKLELEDGQVTSVTLTETLNKDPYADAGVHVGGGSVPLTIWVSNAYCMVASAAMAGEDLDLVELRSFWNGQYGDFKTDVQGLHIDQTITSSGYEADLNYYDPIEGENQEYSRTVTISLTGSDGT